MYAVIQAGGKQYRVELGSEFEIDRIEAEPGASIELGPVLLVVDGNGAQIGRPTVDGARVTANVVRQERGEKIDVFKYKPKARRRVKKGHRAELTIVRVSDILVDGRSAAEAAAAQSRKDEAARAAAEKEAAAKTAADQALAAKLAADEKAAEAATADEKPAKPAKPTAKASSAKPTAKASSAKPAAKSAIKSTKAAAKGTARTKKDE